MPSSIRSSRIIAALSLTAVFIAGCSSLGETPSAPTYPAKIGGRKGVTASEDSICRQQAYTAADKAKQDNATKEVAFTAVGAIAGAVIGNQIQVPSGGGGPRGPARGPGGPRGPAGGPRGPRGPGGPGGRRGPKTHDMAGAGALTGAATGAALSQSSLKDTQQVYDITYNNCIQAYRAR